MRDIVLSSSAVSLFQNCNWGYMLRYIMGWRPEEDKAHFRIGSHWAKCQEIAGSHPGDLCWRCAKNREIDPDCYLCQGGGTVPEDLMSTISRYLDYSYADMPEGFDRNLWETEKLTILYAFCGYQWLYPKAEYEIIASEIPFSLPIIDPVNGRKLAGCRLDGMIDQLWRNKETGRVYIGEQKSTGSNLDNGEFWDKLQMSGQVQTYSYAVWMLWCGGAFEQYGLKPSEATIVTPIYDVWKKPGISPKKLSQADSKKLVETGEYCGHKFEILPISELNVLTGYTIGGIKAEIEPGAKDGTFMIHETPQMYAERLLLDITERPEYYFARKEIPVNETDLSDFAQDCAKLVKTIRFIEKESLWMRNGRSCRNPGKCDYYDVCHNFKDCPLVAENPPEGYKCHQKVEEI